MKILQLQRQIKLETTEYLKENDLAYRFAQDKEVYIGSLKNLMFDPHNSNCGLEEGNRSIFLILLTAGIAILFFAVTNYINLTVAQTSNRAKEMAYRKLLGDSEKKVALRLFIEATIMTLVAFLIGFALALSFETKASELVMSHLDIVSNLSFGTIALYILFIVLMETSNK